MNYKGQELEPITEPQIFDPPRRMLVWDNNYHEPHIEEVCAITNRKGYKVITQYGMYEYCAKIPEQKRATNIQLMQWLAGGNGIWKIRNSNQAFIKASFDIDVLEEEVEAFVIIRPFGSTEWLEPTLDNMGLGE